MSKKGNKKPALGRGLGALLEAQQASQGQGLEVKRPGKKTAGIDDAAVDMAGAGAKLDTAGAAGALATGADDPSLLQLPSPHSRPPEVVL